MQKVRIVWKACTAMLIGAALWTGCSVTPAEGKLQIVYTGNIRGATAPCGCKVSKGGVARLAAFIQRNQDPSANWLMVDAGNLVDRAGNNGGCSAKCQFLINSYEDLKFDAVNVAKQELMMGYQTLRSLADTSRITYVSANLMDLSSGKLMFEPYVVRDYGNMKIGVMGLLRDQDFPPNSSLYDTTAMRVTSQFEAMRKYLPQLSSKVNATILLCESTSDDLDSLLRMYPDIDVVISAGALRSGESMATIGKTRVFGSGSSGYSGHMLAMEFNPTWKDSVAVSSYVDQLTDTYDQIGPWRERLAEFQKSIGTPLKPSPLDSISASASGATTGQSTLPTSASSVSRG